MNYTSDEQNLGWVLLAGKRGIENTANNASLGQLLYCQDSVFTEPNYTRMWQTCEQN
jgi:hypothetical protein